MKAVIVAAGKSTRLYPITKKIPKPLIEIGGKAIIERSIDALRALGIADIAVVVGYLKEMFHPALGGKALFIENPNYESTNDMASLGCASGFAQGDDFLYLHGDLIYDPHILRACLKSLEDAVLVVDRKKCDEEDMKVKLEKGILAESSKEIPVDEAHGEWIGIAKFSSRFSNKLFPMIATIMKEDKNAYDTKAFTALAKAGEKINICPTDGLLWVEIDFKEELERAKRIIENVKAG